MIRTSGAMGGAEPSGSPLPYFVTAGFLYNRNFIHFIAAAEIDDAPGVYHFNGLTG